MKRKLKFINYKNCLINDGIILKSQQRFKSEAHNVFTEEKSKISFYEIHKRIIIKDYIIPIWCKSWKSMLKRATRIPNVKWLILMALQMKTK